MKQFILFLLFFATTISSMQPSSSSAQVDAAAHSIHNNATQNYGSSLGERFAEQVAVGLTIQVLAFLSVDLYQGSKGKIYKLIFGLTDDEKKTIEQQDEEIFLLRNKNNKVISQVLEIQNRNYEKYKAIRAEQIKDAADEEEKAKLLERSKMSRDAMARLHENALQQIR